MSFNINKIIYINLDKRTDRKEQIEKELNSFNLQYTRYSAIHHNSGIVGCGYSHLNVLKIAKEENLKNVLILEDDFTFLVSKEEFENELDKFFKFVGDDYDVCMISYNLNEGKSIPNIDFLGSIISAQTASGYIVNNRYFDKLIELYEKYIPILESTGQHWIYANDQIWKTLQKQDKWYYFIKRIGKQRSGYSDNTQSYVDYEC